MAGGAALRGQVSISTCPLRENRPQFTILQRLSQFSERLCRPLKTPEPLTITRECLCLYAARDTF